MLLRIDLTKPLIRLEYIFLEYGIPISMLYDMKEQGVIELFIEKKDKFEVVFTVHSNGHLGLNDGYPTFMMYEKEIEMIDDVRSFAEDAEITVVLDVDSILDKISKYGTNSLLKEEFDYLYNYK